ncbi:MAG: cyanophycinase [Cytophagaceae bacterium]|nr:cyanophycinase [Gemmatimonadaceae bacterium]
MASLRARALPNVLLALCLVVLPPLAVGLDAQPHGPARGALVISGGAETTPEIYQRFIELAGGPDAPILVVPTSGNAETYDDSCDCLRLLRNAGARNLTLLHTRDRAIANSEAFVAPMRAARGVWFAEGNSWKHADAYLDTRVHRELFALLERGGVVGGGSAGARIQSDFMMLRSPEPAQRAIPEKDWRRGFRLVRDVIIDPHVLARNRQFDLIGVVRAHPGMLGIGIDENTALVVKGNDAEVIGGSYVLIYDDQRQILPEPAETQRTVGGLFYFLRRGDRYDLRTRQAVRPGSTPRPIDRVAERRWPAH